MSAEPNPAPLSQATLRAAIAGLEPWTRLDVVGETGSTNADLLSRSAAGENISGHVLLAEDQSAGRGRQGRVWSAPPGSQVAMSVGVATATVPPDAWGWLPLLTGIAVIDVLNEVDGLHAKLKWPNDILVKSGKIAGILAEVAAPAPAIVIGIGLNVAFGAHEVPPPATSLSMLGYPGIDRNELIPKLLHSLGARINIWSTVGGPDAAVMADYRRHSLTLGTQVRADLPGGHAITGIARDIDDLGRLLIEDSGQIVTVSAGDVTHLRPAAP